MLLQRSLEQRNRNPQRGRGEQAGQGDQNLGHGKRIRSEMTWPVWAMRVSNFLTAKSPENRRI